MSEVLSIVGDVILTQIYSYSLFLDFAYFGHQKALVLFLIFSYVTSFMSYYNELECCCWLDYFLILFSI